MRQNVESEENYFEGEKESELVEMFIDNLE